MPVYDNILFTVEDGLATITLNRPDSLNALSAGMLSDTLSAIREIAKPSSDARGLMITGAGRAFCSGADLGVDAFGDADRDLGEALIQSYHPILLEISALNIPVISVVNGVAAGAGMSIALSADIVIAAKSSYFLQAFVNIGLVPDAGSTYILPRLVGAARARALMMLGERLPAETAQEWGLIFEVVEDSKLGDRGIELATKLANGPTKTLGAIRQLAAQSLKNSYAEQLHLESQMQRDAGRSDDCVEGVMAFIQKRPAVFQGK